MNKVILKRVVVISLLAGAMCCHAAGQYEDRWFYVSRNLTKQEHVREIANIVKTAKAADLNGMLFACGVERWNNWPADRRKRLVEVKHLCDAAGIEIIPVLWSVGYGGHDPAYAAALPCAGVKFTVKGGKAVFAGGGAGEFANAGLVRNADQCLFFHESISLYLCDNRLVDCKCPLSGCGRCALRPKGGLRRTS